MWRLIWVALLAFAASIISAPVRLPTTGHHHHHHLHHFSLSRTLVRSRHRHIIQDRYPALSHQRDTPPQNHLFSFPVSSSHHKESNQFKSQLYQFELIPRRKGNYWIDFLNAHHSQSDTTLSNSSDLLTRSDVLKFLARRNLPSDTLNYAQVRYGMDLGTRVHQTLMEMGPGFEALLIDHGVVSHIHAFRDFVDNRYAIQSERTSPWVLRDMFSNALGSKTLYKAMIVPVGCRGSTLPILSSAISSRLYYDKDWEAILPHAYMIPHQADAQTVRLNMDQVMKLHRETLGTSPYDYFVGVSESAIHAVVDELVRYLVVEGDVSLEDEKRVIVLKLRVPELDMMSDEESQPLVSWMVQADEVQEMEELSEAPFQEEVLFRMIYDVLLKKFSDLMSKDQLRIMARKISLNAGRRINV